MGNAKRLKSIMDVEKIALDKAKLFTDIPNKR